jgi:predicted chitinase
MANYKHTAQAGDTFNTLAKQYYNDELAADALASFNKMKVSAAIAEAFEITIPERIHVLEKITKENGKPVAHVKEVNANILLTAEQLKNISGASDATVQKYLQHFNTVMAKMEINTPLRMAHFLAQVCHESGGLKDTEELASGEDYEGRKILGNTQAGDGKKFKGRGLIQITGRTNYKKFGDYVGQDFTINNNWKKLASDPFLAAEGAGWFWQIYCASGWGSCNSFADNDDVLHITLAINGGFNGLYDRLNFLSTAYDTFNIIDVKDRIKAVFDKMTDTLKKIKGNYSGTF